jgi:Aminotransferase class I and II
MANPNLHDVMGYEPLRRAIASYLRIARDITCSADQILITAGFQGALGLIIQALLKPGAKVWVEDPGYFFARNLLQQAPLRLVGVRIDDGGLNVAAATRSAPDAALALVTPSHQFPLGMTLPVERRLALLDWADRQGAWIVEDDYDCEFHHRGLPPAGAQELGSQRTRPLRRVLQQGGLPRAAAWISCPAWRHRRALCPHRKRRLSHPCNHDSEVGGGLHVAGSFRAPPEPHADALYRASQGARGGDGVINAAVY